VLKPEAAVLLSVNGAPRPHPDLWCFWIGVFKRTLTLLFNDVHFKEMFFFYCYAQSPKFFGIEFFSFLYLSNKYYY
jgi:hypothetical protein